MNMLYSKTPAIPDLTEYRHLSQEECVQRIYSDASDPTDIQLFIYMLLDYTDIFSACLV